MFLRNWRRYQSPDAEYQRFDKYILPAFKKDLDVFLDQLQEYGCGESTLNQAEITYVNHIPMDQDDPVELDRLFNFWASDSGLESIESIDVRTSKVIQGKTNPIGRLYIDIKSGMAQKTPSVALTLTARGFSEPIDEFYEKGHEAIVGTFDQMTTAHMHNLWGKTDE